MAHPVPAPIRSAPIPTLPPPAIVLPPLGVLNGDARQLLLDHVLRYETRPDLTVALTFRGRGTIGVVTGPDLPAVVAAMRRALSSGFVMPLFSVTDAGRRALDVEACGWCEKLIESGQPFVERRGEYLHAGAPGSGFGCLAESESWASVSAGD